MQIVALAGLVAHATGDDAVHQPLHLVGDGVGDDVIADVLLQRSFVVKVLDLDDAARDGRRQVKNVTNGEIGHSGSSSVSDIWRRTSAK